MLCSGKRYIAEGRRMLHHILPHCFLKVIHRRKALDSYYRSHIRLDMVNYSR